MSNIKNYSRLVQVREKNSPCQKKDCRHWLKCKEKLNCSVHASEDGPRTLQEIGDFFGISRMRVCQIEKSILQKLKNSQKLKDFEPSSR